MRDSKLSVHGIRYSTFLHGNVVVLAGVMGSCANFIIII